MCLSDGDNEVGSFFGEPGKVSQDIFGSKFYMLEGNYWKNEKRVTARGEVLQLLRKDRQGVKDLAMTPNYDMIEVQISTTYPTGGKTITVYSISFIQVL